ncbi:MAG: hypothetical protein AB7U20_11375 [Planctomycetaceae bacterium]
MIELTVAAGVLGTVFLVTMPLLSRVRDTRDEVQRRFIAQQEAANILERLASRTSDGPLDDAITQVSVASPEARSVLTNVEVVVTRAAEADDAGLARVSVAISWVNDAGERTAPVTLDAWFPLAEEQR